MSNSNPEIPVAIDQGQVALAIAKAIGSSIVSLSRWQIVSAMWHLAAEENGGPFDDDAGLDWYTDNAGNCYVNANWAWQMSANPNVAAIVDAINTIMRGAPNKMAGERPADMESYDPDAASPPPNLWIRHNKLGTRQALPLNVMDERIEIELENSKGERVLTWLDVGGDSLYLGIEGYGDKSTVDDAGHVLCLLVDNHEVVDPKRPPDARLAVWNDINKEDPRFIGLVGARLTMREDD